MIKNIKEHKHNWRMRQDGIKECTLCYKEKYSELSYENGIKSLEFKETYYDNGNVDVQVFDGKTNITDRPHVAKFIAVYKERLPKLKDLSFFNITEFGEETISRLEVINLLNKKDE